MTDIVIVAATRTAVGKFGGALAKTPATNDGSRSPFDGDRRFTSAITASCPAPDWTANRSANPRTGSAEPASRACSISRSTGRVSAAAAAR